MKRFHSTLLGVLCAFVVHGSERLPNVLLIFADDLGYGDLSCYGASKVQTPNIDRLATEGRRFTDAHSASAVCTPSRYALLTGEYPFRKGIWGPCSHRQPLLIDTNKLTLAQLFKNKGYNTSCFGKWHLGFGKGTTDWNQPLRPGPLELGFDHYFGVPKVNSGFPYVFVEDDRIFGWDPDDPLVFNQKPYSPTPTFPAEAGRKSPNRFGGAKRAHELYHDERVATVLTERAIAWIEAKENDRPFFLYLPTPNIHHPTTPAPRFKGTSQAGLYGDFIHELDWMVGEILACLERNQLAENTMVIFTSDNGGMFNTAGQIAFDHGHKINGDLLGFKFGAWEGGHRVPFLVRWPGKVKPGTTSDQLLSNLDMLATFAAVTGQKLTKKMQADSVNLLPAIVGEPEDQVRDHLILAPNKSTHLSVRKGKWMYIPKQGSGGFTGKKPGDHTFAGPSAANFVGSVNNDFESGKIKADAAPAQLYDLDFDVKQTRNLYREYPEVVEELGALLKKHSPPKPRNPKPTPVKSGKKYDRFKPLGHLRFTFESGNLDGWSIVEGKSGRPVSNHASLPRHKSRPFNHEGEFHLSTVATAVGFTDKQTVVFQSPKFVIQGGRASFLASGGYDADTLYVGLVDAKTKELLFTAGGARGPQMKRTIWEVGKLKGKTVYLQIVDRKSSGWAHLTFDDFSVDGELELRKKQK
jgi:arylsulfatase A